MAGERHRTRRWQLNALPRLLFGMTLLLGTGYAGWRITSLMRADAAIVRGDVAAASQWRPVDPEPLLMLARQRLAAKDYAGAAGHARRVLAHEPADGRAYRVLAQVAAERGDQVLALRMYRIAARRAPRDVPAPAWLAQAALERGDLPDAMIQIDQLLTLSPATSDTLYPVLAKLVLDPAFADALAMTLRKRPPWRGSLLASLRHPGSGSTEAAEALMAAMQRNGGLDAEESMAWIDSLIRQGRWGEAYARWAGPYVAGEQQLPLLFNGSFQTDPSGSGFDWRLPVTPGVLLDFEPGQGVGRVMHARFLGRRVVGAFMEQPLVLAPGRYALKLRQRSDALRSESGLQIGVTCAGKPILLAGSEPFNGSHAWRTLTMGFTVPSQGCAGQWLRFHNAGASGAGQVVSGDLWIADLEISGMGVRP